MDGPALRGHAANESTGATGRNRVASDEVGIFGREAVAGREMICTIAQLKDECALRLAQVGRRLDQRIEYGLQVEGRSADDFQYVGGSGLLLDRKSTRLNSSHLGISYAVFCLKKK